MASHPGPTVKVDVRLPADVVARLDEMATATGQTRSAVLRDAAVAWTDPLSFAAVVATRLAEPPAAVDHIRVPVSLDLGGGSS